MTVSERIKRALGVATKSEDTEPARTETGETPPEDRPGVPGAEGGSQSASAQNLPGHPAEDSAPVGDTDQHSNA